MRQFRNHGITSDHRQRAAIGSWHYEMTSLGYNYRLTDIQCALGLSQLARLDEWTVRRQQIAARYDRQLAAVAGIRPVVTRDRVSHARHLYVIRVDRDAAGLDRASLFAALRDAGIGTAVHYIPVHLHPFYRERFQTGPGLCPAAEAAYEEILSLPIFPAMTDEDVKSVAMTIEHAAGDRSR